VQQSISFSLTLRDQTETGVRSLRVTTRDVIENLVGTNVPAADCGWSCPPIRARARWQHRRLPASDGFEGNIIVDTTSASFNIYQTFFFPDRHPHLRLESVLALFRRLGAELYGTATWSKVLGPGRPGLISLFRERPLRTRRCQQRRSAVHRFNQRRRTQAGELMGKTWKRGSVEAWKRGSVGALKR